MGLTHRRDRPVDLLVGGRLRLDHRAVRAVVAQADVGPHDDGGGVAERLALLELCDLDLRLVDRLEVLGSDDLAVRLVDEVGAGVVPEVLFAVGALVHRARRFAGPEAGNVRALDVTLERGVRGAREPVGRDLRLDDDRRTGVAPDGVTDRRGHRPRRVLHGRVSVYWVSLHAMFFYEIHEGDEELGSAVLLAHERRLDPAEFFALVQKARKLLMDSFEEESLAEAIANELARTAGFIHVTDELLIASVNVDEADEHTYLVDSGDRPN